MDLLKRVGLRIKFLRNEIGMSQEELAYKTGLDRSYMSGIELGKRNFSMKVLERLANSLEVSIMDLFKED